MMLQFRYSSNILLLSLIVFSAVVLPTSNGFNELHKFEIQPSEDDDRRFMLCTKCPDGSIFQLEQPIPIFGHTVKKITVLRNGLIALDDKSAISTPTDYPGGTLSTNQRLQDLDGRYLAVFTTVNNGPLGRITIKEMKPNDSEGIGCYNLQQLERIEKFIHFSYPQDENFITRSLISITWENMTNIEDGDSKSNSHTIVLLTNGIKSYGLIQYWKIQWPHGDQTHANAMPPQAGVIIENTNGLQLPRSTHSVKASEWLSESNIASAGEWLIPLYKTESPRDVSSETMLKIRKEFIFSLKLICAINLGPTEDDKLLNTLPELINDAPTVSNSAGHLNETTNYKGYEYDYDYDYDIFGEGGEPLGSDDTYWTSPTETVDYISAGHVGAIDEERKEDDQSTEKLSEENTEKASTDEVIKLVRDQLNLDVTEIRKNKDDEGKTAEHMSDPSDAIDIQSIDGDVILSTEEQKEDTEVMAKTDYTAEVVEPEIVPVTEIPLGMYDGDEERTLEPSLVPKTYNPLEQDETDIVEWHNTNSDIRLPEPRLPEPRLSQPVHLERCDATSECQVTNAECYRVESSSCCVCPQKYYGSGNKRCWEESYDYTFALRGNLTTSFNDIGNSQNFPIYLDIQNGKVQRTSSGVRQGIQNDPTYQTIRLFTPMFHVLNSLISKACTERELLGGVRPYNLFTLAGGLRTGLTMQFFFDIQYVGKITASVNFIMDEDATDNYARGAMNIQLTSTEPITLIDRAYREANEVSGTPDRTYYASYHVDDYGRVVFDENSIEFVAESRGMTEEQMKKDKLLVHWSAIGEVANGDYYSAGCLLKNGSPLAKHHSFYVRMLDRGYCSEDCASMDGTCQLFCVDVPLVTAQEPNACSCIECPGEGEVCVTQGAMHLCQCAPGLARMEDRTCRVDPYGKSANQTVGSTCGRVLCHSHARCIDPNAEFCQCLPGYRGDGRSFCEDDPCSRCNREEVCVNDVCRPSGIDLCYNISCGLNAFCRDGSCICTPGFTGDPMAGCVEERDPCYGVTCHPLAYCRQGRCYCRENLVGDGYLSCRCKDGEVVDPCDHVRCHAMARCEYGQCRCMNGYVGDGYLNCTQYYIDKCLNVRCHTNAYCQDGHCLCDQGFEGDGYYDCRPTPTIGPSELCAGAQCHEYGQCYENRCYCKHGYVGDGVTFCEPHRQDQCDGVRCADNAFCRDGRCLCAEGFEGDGYNQCRRVEDRCALIQCNPYAQCYDGQCRCMEGYEGDGIHECRPMDGCSRIRCHPDAQCQSGRCHCRPGFSGDGYNQCIPIVEDQCANVRCHRLARCEYGRCNCIEGYVGDGYYDCRTIIEDLCRHITCHPNASCYNGACHCNRGFEGDGIRDCHPIRRCIEERCHPDAYCMNDRCQCKDGYQGDGYSQCTPISECSNCQGHPLKEMARCINGQCVCAPGFIQKTPGLCTECIEGDCHKDAKCLVNSEYQWSYSCQCNAGYSGDGVTMCEPDGVIDPTCGGGCFTPNAECNRHTGTCTCRRGYTGDGYTKCEWNCQLCMPNAICDRVNERCNCPPGFHGDGQTFCEAKPSPVKVHILGQGDVHLLADLDNPLILNCSVTTTDLNVRGQWSPPKGSQEALFDIKQSKTGFELTLVIQKPALSDAGRYVCKAGEVEAYIDVVIENTAVPYDVFLSSDDGILKVRSSGENSSMATLWNLAENNKYDRISMVTDCKTKRVIYTCDYGHSIRYGDAKASQKELTTLLLFQSQLNKFSNLAVDPPSGNVFAWDATNKIILVFNPAKPHLRHTLKNIESLQKRDPVRFAGMALHSGKGLIYWAAFADGWMPNGTIQVVSMSGEGEIQLIQLAGEPLALSLSASYDETDQSAGRLCWIQRSITNVFALATEMHCARLSADGRRVITQERLRQFSASEEPSWGLIHHRGTVLWTDANKPVYYSANPARRVNVRLVCCSNRFQSISALDDCNKAMNNPCGYSNGRCRYFCLPGLSKRSRSCVCPDTEDGCQREI